MKSQINDRPLLSVCIPIYNHANLLREQIRSIGDSEVCRSDVEFVIVDDCSTDGLPAVVDFFRRSGWSVTYVRQDSNQGRAPALARAVSISNGDFVMLMDGDDTFETGALDTIIFSIKQLNSTSSPVHVCGFVFGTVISERSTLRAVKPPDGLEVSLLSLRADYGVKGDLKEVIRSDVIKSAICPLFSNFRRVPTSLIWARISESHKVKCKSETIVHKVYLSGGMTKTIGAYRRDGVPALLELYETIYTSSSFNSVLYRIRAVVNYHRFYAWPHSGRYRFDLIYWGIPGAIGYLLGKAEFLLRKLKR